MVRDCAYERVLILSISMVALSRNTSRKASSACSTRGRSTPSTTIMAANPIAWPMALREEGGSFTASTPLPTVIVAVFPPAGNPVQRLTAKGKSF